MIKLLQLNRKVIYIFCTLLLILQASIANSAEDIWKNNENQTEQLQTDEKKIIQSPILAEDSGKIELKINEEKIENFNQNLIGIFDPEKNNFSLNMWSESDGEDVKKVLNRINNLKLSKFSENLLFEVLFTNSYSPKKNLNSEEFLKIKINWLISKKRFRDLEILLKNNNEARKQTKAIKSLVNEDLAAADIKSACEKTQLLAKGINNDYLDKLLIYCLIKDERKDEAQLLFDLIIERGLKDKFFEDKFYYLLGLADKTNQKISDKNILNFYLSHITLQDFKYAPTEKTDKYIWRYLASANLLNFKNFENEDVIITYEKVASENFFKNNEVFQIYLQMPFNFNQLVNSAEIYKNLSNYQARALIYQSLILSVDVERKLYLAFLLKELFVKDNLLNVYESELSNILKKIDLNSIPERYIELVNLNLDPNFVDVKKIKFQNEIFHRSKIIKHFIDNYEKKIRTEKDLKSVYKKIKKNKKYFISIMDIVVLESLAHDGVKIPKDLNYTSVLSELSIPQNLSDLVKSGQTGMVMLKIIEIIGEDKIKNLDPETIYFLTRILNELNLKKIRNNILSEVLPVKI